MSEHVIRRVPGSAAWFVGVCLFAFVGCGAPAKTVRAGSSAPAKDGAGGSFVGTFEGPITMSNHCPVVPPILFAGHFVITENGDTLTWTAPCGATATATVNGNTAAVHPYDCPAKTVGGITESLTISGGTLSVDGASLSVTFTGATVTSGSVSGRCDVSFAGTLSRRG